MVQEMLSFLEGRFGGQSFWWGVGAGFCCWTWKLKHNPQCLWGFLWRERNACCFDRQDLSVAKLKYLLLKSFNEWKSSPMSSLTWLLKYLDFLGLHLSFVVVFISYFIRSTSIWNGCNRFLKSSSLRWVTVLVFAFGLIHGSGR